MLHARVRTDLRRFNRIRNALLAGNTDPRIRQMQTAWCDRYTRYAESRWRQFASGGGTWAPLSPVTIRKRQRRGRTMTTILLVTRALIAALHRGRSGNVINFFSRFGVRFGIGGDDVHPDSGLPYGKLAMIHQRGTKSIPARPMIVLPDSNTLGDLVRIAAVSVRNILNRP